MVQHEFIIATGGNMKEATIMLIEEINKFIDKPYGIGNIVCSHELVPSLGDPSGKKVVVTLLCVLVDLHEKMKMAAGVTREQLMMMFPENQDNCDHEFDDTGMICKKCGYKL